MPSLDELLGRWRDDLSAWAIPEGITSSVTESPWVLPPQVFARRADLGKVRQGLLQRFYAGRAGFREEIHLIDAEAGPGALES